jgi:hypothetical protein
VSGFGRRSTFVMAAALLVGSGACQTEPASVSGEARVKPLCPDCESLSAADEAVSIGSRLNCCASERSAIASNDPRALALGVERYVRWIEAGYQGPLEWRRRWGSSALTGFEPLTRIELVARVEGIEWVRQTRSDSPSNPLLCPSIACDDYLELTIQTDMRTADGALAGSGTVRGSAFSPAFVTARADLPIADFAGALNLAGVDERPRVGGVFTSVTFFEGGVQGTLTPWVSELPFSPGSLLSSLAAAPLPAMWPAKACRNADLPLDLDEPLPRPMVAST